MTRVTGSIATCMLGAVLAACGESAPGWQVGSGDALGPDVTVDSAGVRIVTTAVRPFTPRWTLAAEPELQLGAMDGEAPQLFSCIRFAVRLADGGVAVADGRSGEIRFFEERGRFVRSVGSHGPGPGEFQDFSGVVWMPGDTLAVYDLLNQRITLVTPEGLPPAEFSIREIVANLRGDLTFPVMRGDRVPLSPGDGVEQIVRCRDQFSAGPLSGSRHAALFTSRWPPPHAGDARTYHARIDLLLFDLDQESIDRILTLPGPTMVRLPFRGSRELNAAPVPFAHDVLVAVSRDLVVVSNTGRYELRIIDGDGKLLRIIRRSDVAPTPIDAEHREAYTNWQVRRPGAASEDFVRRTAEAGFEVLQDAHLPTHSDLFSDEEGRIWVRDPFFAWQSDLPPSYSVFGPDGRVLATATLPPRFRVLHIGSEHITGHVLDDLGVEYVRIHRIVTGPAQEHD